MDGEDCEPGTVSPSVIIRPTCNCVRICDSFALITNSNVKLTCRNKGFRNPSLSLAAPALYLQVGCFGDRVLGYVGAPAPPGTFLTSPLLLPLVCTEHRYGGLGE